MGSELTWEAPGPGSWQLLADHYPRPVTAAAAPLAEVWTEASTTYMQDLGLPIKSARMVAVNGLPYLSIAPEGGGGGRRPPPPWLLKLLVRVTPSLRRAERRLTQVFEERPWVQGIAAWHEAARPSAIERMRALAGVDPDALDDEALASHVEAVESELLDSMRQHVLLHGHDTVPPGLFAVTARKWGLTPFEALDLLRGSSPASTGGSPELDRLRRAVGGRSADSVVSLRALGPDVAEALDDFLLLHGWRVIDGYDVDCRCLAEAPALVVRLATMPAPSDDTRDLAGRSAAARARIPAEDRDEFDRLLTDARAAYGLRDDNGSILVAWPTGLLRRAMLAAGRRLHGVGLLSDPALAIEAEVTELTESLRRHGVLDSAGLAARAERRARIHAADAPRTLGPPEAPAPPGLPGALGTAFAIFDVYELRDPAPANPTSTNELRGTGIGTASFTGTARLVLGGDSGIDRFEPGDVLVAPMTSPSYNLLLSLAGALVTEEGGTMSHAAIMARELGIPAVLGAPGATRLIEDGDCVTVAPATGTVTVER